MEGIDQLDLEELLVQYFRVANDTDAEALLSRVIGAFAVPKVRTYFQSRTNPSYRSVGSGLSQVDTEDLVNEASLKLLKALRRHRSLQLEGVQNIDAYIKRICYSTYSDYWRERYFEYSKLKNRIRYVLLGPQSEFEIRRDRNGKLSCALPESTRRTSADPIEQIVDAIKENLDDHPVLDEPILIEAVLKRAGGWILLDDIVKIIAVMRGVDAIPPFETGFDDGFLEINASDNGSEDLRREHVSTLTALWQAIQQLPRFQKLALLYNLRDKDRRELNTVWFETGIATLAEIAEQFEVTEEMMANLLFRLPFSDIEIAEVLARALAKGDQTAKSDVKRVRDLRQCAREKLQRRLEGKQKRNRQ